MSFQGHRILAVVPARGGSKTIPRKNLETVCGQSLIAWAAEAARSCHFLDAAMITTDDEQMAQEGRCHGLEVPFLRPAELSGDTVRAAPVWKHAWLEMERRHATTYFASILLEPTSPLRKPEDIESVLTVLLDGPHKSSATASRTPSHHTPEKQLRISARGTLEFLHERGVQSTVRQTIPTYYHRNGLCYAALRPTVVDNEKIFEEDCAAVITQRPVVDINEPIDLMFAECLMLKDPHFQQRVGVQTP